MKARILNPFLPSVLCPADHPCRTFHSSESFCGKLYHLYSTGWTRLLYWWLPGGIVPNYWQLLLVFWIKGLLWWGLLLGHYAYSHCQRTDSDFRASRR